MSLTGTTNTLDNSQLAHVTATRCCVCHALLTDAESLQIGLGPTCSKRYYNPLHIPTSTQVKVALGYLAASGLPDHIIDGFLKLVDNNHVNARKSSNLLSYWASAHYDNRDEVFKCTGIIRALGYTELADKLETDRTAATLLVKPDIFEAFLPDKHTLNRDVEGIPGAVPLFEDGQVAKQGHKIGWKVPLLEKAHLETVLGVHCGGELMCGTEGIRIIPRKRWADVQAFRTPTKVEGGKVQIETSRPGKLEIHSPYNRGFINALKASLPKNDRAWNGTCWVVAERHLETIKHLVQMHYGCPLGQR